MNRLLLELTLIFLGLPAMCSAATELTATGIRGLVQRDGSLWQPVEIAVKHSGPAADATIDVEGAQEQHQPIKTGSQTIQVLVRAVSSARQCAVSLKAAGQTLTSSATLRPVRKVTIYVLPHSHHDLGYTDLQANVEKKQMENIRRGIEIARRTADNPEGARFVWNLEVLWGADLYMHRMSEADRAEFLDAVKKGQVALNGMYANELTGLCRPEELLQLFRYGTRLSEKCGVKLDSAMQSDVPGMTWGTCTAMSQAGIRYFSLAPNYFDRIGSIMVQWQDKPFWWVSPSGNEKVLVWVPWTGYAMSHIVKKLSDKWIDDYQQRLDSIDYPYDISYIRWSGHGDNAEPDPQICEFIKSWNTQYAWPKLVISSTSTAFSALEKRYGDKLPQFKGDLTPYWEDGAASSALETAMNRNSSERLVQAETLFAMRARDRFPAEAFADAWRNVLLYSEHTWGAWCSVSDSENPFTLKQWAVKKGFAEDADRESHELLSRACGAGTASGAAIDVFNTSSWPRVEIVLAPRELSAAGDRVTDPSGQPIPSQRLSTGELAILARVPPLAGIRYKVRSGDAFHEGLAATAQDSALDNGLIHVRVDPTKGAIIELRRRDIDHNFAGTSNGRGLNDYCYLPGKDLKHLSGSGPVKITEVEKGPLLASLRIESEAPGCNKLTRELRLGAGMDFVKLIDTLDKKRVPLNPHPGQGGPGGAFAQRGNKESVSFAFPLDVKDGQIRLNVPYAVMRPEADQLPGACKNWLPVGRWADVSNSQMGATLATLDAPLVELGHLSTLLGSQSNPDVWRKHIEPTQMIYSWVMNNHWGTNYRAYQDGVVSFRYALRPHGKFEPVDTARFGTGLSQPLIVSAASGQPPSGQPLLRVDPPDVLVSALKPSDDGKGLIVRLFGVSGEDRQAKLIWAARASPKMWLSDLSEKPGSAITNEVTVPGWGLVTVRAQ